MSAAAYLRRVRRMHHSMPRPSILRLACVAHLWGSAAFAQGDAIQSPLTPAVESSVVDSSPSIPRSLQLLPAQPASRQRARTYVLTGALVGSVIVPLTLGRALYQAEIGSRFAVYGGTALVGGLVGALIGRLVFETVRKDAQPSMNRLTGS